MNTEPIIGIDLGTTNSEVAIIENGRTRVLEEDGKAILPSMVGLTEDGKLLVGEAARNQWLFAPDRTIRSVKRRMGEDVKLSLGDQTFSPQEISAMILRTLKLRAEKHLGRPVSKAVITVPAFFNDAQRQATREAGELAGLEVVRIIHEPTAASLTYEANHANAQTILVYDLGGGTFDVSIVRIESNVVEVLASHGDTHLGGDDFDALLVDHVAEQFLKEHGVDLRTDARGKATLLRAVEAAKIRLSSEPYTAVTEEYIARKDGQPLHLNMEIERYVYEDLIRPLIERTMDSVQTALTSAGILAENIDKIVLAGGATRTPLVQEELKNRTGRQPHQEVEPDLCVAMGAAIQAGIIAGEQVGAVLVDVTPHTFGVRCLSYEDGLPTRFCFSPIIRRNSALPSSKTEIYTTLVDEQPSVVIDVYQGEDPDVRKNTQIGSFTVEGLSKVPASNPILCRLDLDLNGMLKVTAREKITGLEKHILIDNAMSRFEREEMDAASLRLRRMFDDHDDAGAGDAPAGHGERLAGLAEAGGRLRLTPRPEGLDDKTIDMIQRAEKMLTGMAVTDRDEITGLLQRIHDAAQGDPEADVQKAAAELEDILFYLEEA